MSSERSAAFKKTLLVYSLNALIVLLALFLSYRILAPSYERKESVSVNKLGMFHTQLAAERLGARLSNLRDELKENAMRLVDPSRGPVTLDSSTWLWLRIQDHDWRAPNYLDPLPAPRTDVDTWAVSAAKNYLIITERLPIMKGGVQDFVIVEGGVKANVFQDLQSERDYGLWVFDLEAYKKGGLSVAKLYEISGTSGALSKDDLKLLTSDVLAQVFQGTDVTVLQGPVPWALSFKNSSGPTRLGILGYWSTQPPPLDVGGTWASLAVALLLLSCLGSFVTMKFGNSPEIEMIEPVAKTHSQIQNTVAPSKEQEINPLEKQTTANQYSFDGILNWMNKVLGRLKDPLGQAQDRVEVALEALQRNTEDAGQRATEKLLLARTEIWNTRSAINSVNYLLGDAEIEFESLDLELFYKEMMSRERLPHIDTFFDPDLWRINSDKGPLGLLLKIYISYFLKHSSPETKLQVTARFVPTDIEDLGAFEMKRASNFKIPFVRIAFHQTTAHPLGRSQLQEAFELMHQKDKDADIELPLSLKIVDALGGRLKVKSNFEDGNVFTLDFAAFEERRAEDKVNAKQFNQVRESFEPEKIPLPDDPEEQKTVIQSEGEEKPFTKEQTDSGMRIMRLAEIEKAKSFADNISDERSRVRSRFRIRKPGEKE